MNDKMGEREEGIERLERVMRTMLNSWLPTSSVQEREIREASRDNFINNEDLIFLFSEGGEEVLKESIHDMSCFHV